MIVNSTSNTAMFKILEGAILQRKRALDYLQEGITITDPNIPDNPLVYVNDSFLKLTGYTRDEVVNNNCRFLQGPETDPHTLQEIRNALEAKKPITVELINYKKDGSKFWNHLTISPVYNDRKELVNYVAVQRDVTHYRDMELHLKNKEKEVNALKKAVQLLKERVQEQEDTIGSFIMHQ